MIKIIAPFNYKGVIIDAGTVLNLDSESEEKMINAGTAVNHIPEETKIDDQDDNAEKPLEKMTKTELLELATSLGIEGLSEKNNKDEIIAGIKAHE